MDALIAILDIPQFKRLKPRQLAAHWIANKDVHFINNQAAMYKYPDKVKAWVRLYIQQLKRLRIKDEE